MNKPESEEPIEDDISPEYDLRGKKLVRGRYLHAFDNGYSVVVHNEDGTETVTNYPPPPRQSVIVLEPDVEEYFPDSASVNHALRTLIALIPKRKAKRVAAPRKRRKLDV
jgi:hypothetical protein